jgi:light-regulated signal transduction histidine kinase (bacteriophytochrome)
MTSRVPSLAEQYADALEQYLGGSGEAALSQAYELGREAMSSGLGVLDIAAIYRDAVNAAVLRGEAPQEGFARAAEFFAESLAPFEMTFRGYVEANQRLHALNQTLAAQNVELRNAKAVAEAANRELESFSYSVSHDLRAPLRAVNGFSKILISDFLAHLPVEAQMLLNRVTQAGERMEQLITDLLEFSRLGRQPLAKRPVDMTRLVQATVEELRRAQPERQVELRLSHLPDSVGDPSLLKQVIVNLLSNAFKFTRRQATGIIEVGARQEQGENVYFVRDNGAGFDMKYADRLFNVFQRLHREDEFEGTGVGLSIVQRIVQRHGGRIWVDAAVDQGATFHFTLPR